MQGQWFVAIAFLLAAVVEAGPVALQDRKAAIDAAAIQADKTADLAMEEAQQEEAEEKNIETTVADVVSDDDVADDDDDTVPAAGPTSSLRRADVAEPPAMVAKAEAPIDHTVAMARLKKAMEERLAKKEQEEAQKKKTEAEAKAKAAAVKAAAEDAKKKAAAVKAATVAKAAAEKKHNARAKTLRDLELKKAAELARIEREEAQVEEKMATLKEAKAEEEVQLKKALERKSEIDAKRKTAEHVAEKIQEVKHKDSQINVDAWVKKLVEAKFKKSGKHLSKAAEARIKQAFEKKLKDKVEQRMKKSKKAVAAPAKVVAAPVKAVAAPVKAVAAPAKVMTPPAKAVAAPAKAVSAPEPKAKAMVHVSKLQQTLAKAEAAKAKDSEEEVEELEDEARGSEDSSEGQEEEQSTSEGEGEEGADEVTDGADQEQEETGSEDHETQEDGEETSGQQAENDMTGSADGDAQEEESEEQTADESSQDEDSEEQPESLLQKSRQPLFSTEDADLQPYLHPKVAVPRAHLATGSHIVKKQKVSELSDSTADLENFMADLHKVEDQDDESVKETTVADVAQTTEADVAQTTVADVAQSETAKEVTKVAEAVKAAPPAPAPASTPAAAPAPAKAPIDPYKMCDELCQFDSGMDGDASSCITDCRVYIDAGGDVDSLKEFVTDESFNEQGGEKMEEHFEKATGKEIPDCQPSLKLDPNTKFDVVDENGDGHLTRKEMDSWAIKACVPNELTQQIFEAADSNFDEAVTPAEYGAIGEDTAYESVIDEHVDKLTEGEDQYEPVQVPAFRHVDSDSNGKLDKQEIMNMFKNEIKKRIPTLDEASVEALAKEHQQELLDDMDNVDTGGDGMINESEYYNSDSESGMGEELSEVAAVDNNLPDPDDLSRAGQDTRAPPTAPSPAAAAASPAAASSFLSRGA